VIFVKLFHVKVGDNHKKSQIKLLGYNKYIFRYECVDVFSERQTPNKNRGGALWSGANGPRPGAGRSATWRRARVLCLTAGRSARTQRRQKSPAAAWISLPGGTSSGRRDPR
jgi:hypothetical protein